MTHIYDFCVEKLSKLHILVWYQLQTTDMHLLHHLINLTHNFKTPGTLRLTFVFIVANQLRKVWNSKHFVSRQSSQLKFSSYKWISLRHYLNYYYERWDTPPFYGFYGGGLDLFDFRQFCFNYFEKKSQLFDNHLTAKKTFSTS